MKPAFARTFIILGRVKASARKMTSGWAAWTSRISHSQNFTGFVCGLSTRKVCTPCPIQNSRMRRISSHKGRGSGHWKLSG